MVGVSMDYLFNSRSFMWKTTMMSVIYQKGDLEKMAQEKTYVNLVHGLEACINLVTTF